MTRIYSSILFCFFLLSCAKPGQEATTLNESVDYHFEATSSFTQFDPIVHLAIVETDDDLIFGSVNQIQLLSDGSLLAFDPNLITIHHFDSLGNVLHRIGREGSGPGEFSNEAIIRSDGKKVYVFERVASKVEVFEFQHQTWVHQRTISIDKVDEDVPQTLLKADENDLWFIYRHFYQGANGARLAKDHITKVSMSQESESLAYDTWLAELPQTEAIFEDLGGFIASYPKPFGPRSISAITSEGHIILSKTDRFRFSRVISEIDSTFIFQMDVPNILLSDAQKNNMTGYSERIHALIRDHMPEVRPSTIPIILPDEKNGFWVGYESIDFDERRWLYVNHDNQISKEIRLPANFRPHVAIDRMIYGVLSNEDGSQSIIGYSLHRT